MEVTLETPEVNRAFTAISRAGAAKAALEFLGEDLASKQHALDMQIFSKLERGEPVDPQLALQVYTQKWAVWQFMHKLLASLKQGETASRILAPLMDINGGEFHGTES